MSDGWAIGALILGILGFWALVLFVVASYPQWAMQVYMLIGPVGFFIIILVLAMLWTYIVAAVKNAYD